MLTIYDVRYCTTIYMYKFKNSKEVIRVLDEKLSKIKIKIPSTKKRT